MIRRIFTFKNLFFISFLYMGFQNQVFACEGEKLDFRGAAIYYLNEDGLELSEANIEGRITELQLVFSSALTPEGVDAFLTGIGAEYSKCELTFQVNREFTYDDYSYLFFLDWKESNAWFWVRLERSGLITERDWLINPLPEDIRSRYFK